MTADELIPGDESERQRTAYHEAGHAVAAYRGGFDSNYLCAVSTVPDPGKGTFGWACYADQFSDIDSPEMEAWLLSMFAGYAAELQFCPREAERIHLTAASDFEKAAPWLAIREESEGVWIAKAAEFVQREWEAIERVAQQLLLDEQLDGEDLQILLDPDDPDHLATLAHVRTMRAYFEARQQDQAGNG